MKKKIIAGMIICMFILITIPTISMAEPSPEPEDIPPVWKTFIVGLIQDPYIDDTTYSFETLHFTAVFVLAIAKDTTSDGGPIPYILINKHVALYNKFSIDIRTGTSIIGIFDGKPILP